jgi:hypothetical protein
MCESHFETDYGVEDYIQRSEDEDEMVVFFGEVDPRAIEDMNHLKLTMKNPSIGLLESSILIKG